MSDPILLKDDILNSTLDIKINTHKHPRVI